MEVETLLVHLPLSKAVLHGSTDIVSHGVILSCPPDKGWNASQSLASSRHNMHSRCCLIVAGLQWEVTIPNLTRMGPFYFENPRPTGTTGTG